MIIDYWEKWTGEEAAAIQRVVDLFNASQSRTWVRRTPVSDIKTKAMVAIAGGDPPDVVGLFSFNIPLLAESGAAMALDELATPDTPPSATPYKPAVQRLLSYNGRVWAGVSSCYTLALYYNRSLFRNAGLNPDNPPRTISEFDAASEQLTLQTPTGDIERAGFLHNVPLWWPYFWPTVFGGSLYDHKNAQATIASQKGIDAYAWIQGYPNRLGREATARFATTYARAFHQADDPFFTGRAAMVVQGPWIASFIARQKPDLDYAATPVPVADLLYQADAPLGLVEADVLIIPRGCRHPQEAYDFVRFTQRQDMLELLASLHGKSSPLLNVSPSFTAQHTNRYVSVHDAITASPRADILPQTRVWQQYSDLTISAFQAIWDGADVKSTLQTTEYRAQSLIDHAVALRARRALLKGSGA